jgi:hypothetical protein
MGKTAFLLNKEAEKRKFDKSKVELQPFAFTGLSAYPYKAKEGSIPVSVMLIQNAESVSKTREIMAKI